MKAKNKVKKKKKNKSSAIPAKKADARIKFDDEKPEDRQLIVTDMKGKTYM